MLIWDNVSRYSRHLRMQADSEAAQAASEAAQAASEAAASEAQASLEAEAAEQASIEAALAADTDSGNVYNMNEEGTIAQPDKSQIIMTDTSVDWRLILVNPWHRLPDSFEEPVTVRINDDAAMSIDERCFDDYMAMIEACRAAGGDPIVRGSFRTQAQQEELFQNKKNQYLEAGESDEQAELDAATVVAYPGTSEHQLGLAIDICSSEDAVLDEAQADTKTQQWLMENCWDYGFILRYPDGKQDITGIIYEPWHYRYVGKEVAQKIQQENLCLEEYLAIYENVPLPPGIVSDAVNAAAESAAENAVR